jgi:DNA polymerase-3 subunit delta'
MIFEWQQSAWRKFEGMRQTLPHALLLVDPGGHGGVEFASQIAAAVLCESAPAPCGQCSACRWMADDNHPDFRRLTPAAMEVDAPEPGAVDPAEADAGPGAANRGESREILIDQVRALSDFLAIGTHRGGYRVVLVHPAEALNRNAANGLLKSLEEPTRNTLFLLVTGSPSRLLATIRSRCVRFDLPRADRLNAERWLNERGRTPADALLAFYGGSPMRAAAAGAVERFEALAFLDDIFVRSDFDPLEFAVRCDIALAKGQKDGWLGAATAPATVVERLLKLVHDLALPPGIAAEQRYFPTARAAQLHEEKALGVYRRLLELKSVADHPLNVRLFLDDLFIQLAAQLRSP